MTTSQQTDAFETKRQRILQYLVDLGYEGMVIGAPRNFAWLTGGRTNAVVSTSETGLAYLKVTARYVRLIATTVEAPRMRDEVIGDLPVELVEVPWHDADALAAEIRRDARHLRLIGDVRIPGGGIAQMTRPFWTMQAPLLPDEIARYRALGRDAGAVVGDVGHRMCPGWSEHRVAGEVAGALRAGGMLPAVLLVGGDDRLARYRHPVPTDTPVERCCMIVVCAERNGLVASLTRIVHFGAVPEELAARHQAAADVDAALLAASVPGATLGEVFQAGVAAYAAAGYPEEWRNHHQGGTTGYNTRDVIATPESPERLVAGQAVAWNPSVPGAKSEDTFLVTEDGPDLLTPTPNWPTIQAGQGAARRERPAILER